MSPLLFWIALVGAPEPAPLNVIIITADTLRADVTDHPAVYTPHLDRLAERGTRFERAYTPITTTLPSHASLFTSLYPSDHRAYSNVSRLSSRISTLAETLDAQGYETAAHINLPWLRGDTGNVPQGFQVVRGGDRVRKADKTWPWVERWLAQDHDAPFLLWLHFVDNHTPYHAPHAYQDLYFPPDATGVTSLESIWHLFPGEQRRNEHFHAWTDGVESADYLVGSYMGSVTWLDAHVGLLVHELEEQGLTDNTLIVFTSDHGEAMGEHDLWFVHGGLFEGTTHIPLIVMDPRREGGQRVSTVVSLVDVMPTVLDSVGVAGPEGMRGQSLWTMGEDAGGAALLEHTGAQLEGVVTQRWKLIRHLKTRAIYGGYPIVDGTVELYDLSVDPEELFNIADRNPDVVAELTALMGQLKAGDRSYQEGQVDVDDTLREQLEAMGYFDH